VRAKIVKSFARIHRANLANFGIVFLTFKDPLDYERVAAGARVTIPGLRRLITAGQTELPVGVDGLTITCLLEATPRQRQYLLAGSALNFVRRQWRQ
jgi:aconitate hydratase